MNDKDMKEMDFLAVKNNIDELDNKEKKIIKKRVDVSKSSSNIVRQKNKIDNDIESIKNKHYNRDNNLKEYLDESFEILNRRLDNYFNNTEAYKNFIIIKNSIYKLRKSGKVREALDKLEELLGDNNG